MVVSCYPFAMLRILIFGLLLNTFAVFHSHMYNSQIIIVEFIELIWHMGIINKIIQILRLKHVLLYVDWVLTEIYDAIDNNLYYIYNRNKAKGKKIPQMRSEVNGMRISYKFYKLFISGI